MVIKTLLIIITGTVLFAKAPLLSKDYPIINAYQGQYKGSRTFSQNQKLTQTECFSKANKFIYDDTYKKELKLKIGDPNVLKSQKTVMRKTADYKSALIALKDCAIKNHNPIAAWEGLKIISSFLGINYNGNIKDYRTYSKILYDDKSCDGYVNYGDINAKGIYQKPNHEKAKKIFKEGLKVCKGIYQNIVLNIKLTNLEIKRK